MPKALYFPTPRYEIDRLFDTLVHTAWGRSSSGACSCPPTDITELEDRYLVVMDLPGVRNADLSIVAERRTLRIEGMRQDPWRDRDRRLHLRERVHGRFARSFRLPDDADPEQIRARLSEGVLTVEIPRTERRRS